MDYFDCDYFDETYFDTPDCGGGTDGGRGGRVRRIVLHEPQPVDEAEELFAWIP